MVELIGDDSLSALVDVNMFDGLLPWLVEPCQCLQLGTAIRLSLQREPHVAFYRFRVLAEVER
jgi:hypothetical protein